MKNLMSDIQSGFVQRRLPDGGFKVSTGISPPTLDPGSANALSFHFQQQYSPMVMRKFRRSVDNTSALASEDSPSTPPPSVGLNSPRLSRKFRGGSLSGPSLPDSLNAEVPNSPGFRRRRSRIPSEEDDKLFNFLTKGGHDGSRERNTSAGNLGNQPQLDMCHDGTLTWLLSNLLAVESQYGSLDRGLLRRSRGRKRTDIYNEDRNRQPAPVPETKALDTSKEVDLEENPSGGKFKNRISAWLKDAEEDASQAQRYLDKKKERQTTNVKPERSGVMGGHKNVPDAIVDKTDVIKAMETIETVSTNGRRKSPPSDEIDRKKQLIRELGRKPSEEKVSLYVRKPSIVPEKQASSENKAKTFLDNMAKKSTEVPTDFLNTIEEESKKKQPLAKKYPFNRTTTPNSLREHLRETLVKNLGSNDLSDTIQSIKDDEIRDTFDIDSENIETPPMQRRALRPKSMRLPSQEDEDTVSVGGSDIGNRRKNQKFRTLGGDGKPLGDRELLIKKNRASSADVSAPMDNLDDELGLFDRFSTARKSISKSSLRRKGDEDTMSLNDLNLDKKSGKPDWRSRLANRFKKAGDNYDIQEAENRKHSQDESYRKISDDLPSAPMTEPPRRKTLNIPSTSSGSNGRISSAKVIRPRQANSLHMRKSSTSGEYDSEMINGKYVTSVPIMSPQEEFGDDNLRPRHRKDQTQPASKVLRDIQKPLDRKNSLMDRLSSRSNDKEEVRRATSGNVFDRLNNNRTSNLSASRGSINGSRRSLASVSEMDQQKRGTLSRIKDLTKNLRKGSREEESSVVAPRDSRRLFTERKPMTNLNRNNGSRSSINSSSRSLNRSDANKNASPKVARRSTLNVGGTNRASSRSVPSRALGSSGSLRSPATSTNNINKRGLGAHSSKENLSRSSSSTSNSLSTNDLTRSTGNSTSPAKTSMASIRLSNPSSSFGRGAPTTSPVKPRKATASASLSFMKPTASSVKKLSASVVEDAKSPTRRPQKMSTPVISRNTRR
eukprot:maker-scaffold408_size180710-snap-gene-0.43 protein:Tk05218 transcript:maker-scaffold408_size180710-snap-gene-0.43-mRNA-1 annotation:"hypothetical protein SINV_13681"